jgi:hypothetical protein
VADFMADRIAAKPPVLGLEGVEVALVEDDDPLLRDELPKNPAVIVTDRLPQEAEAKVVEEALDVEARRELVPLPERGGAVLDLCLRDEAHVSGGEILSCR